MNTGNTIYQFLQRCLDSLRKDFHELKTISADQLMYVKEDLIIPHHYSFYDFIVTKVLYPAFQSRYLGSTLIICFCNTRLAEKVDRYSVLTYMTIYELWVMPALRKMSHTLEKCYLEVGTKGTSIYFQLPDGNRMIQRKHMKNIVSKIRIRRAQFEGEWSFETFFDNRFCTVNFYQINLNI